MKTSPNQVFEIVDYSAKWDGAWDGLVARAEAGTFLHTRRFLSYHRARFQDCSLLALRKGNLVAVFPAALVPDASSLTIASHPGATFGGVVQDGSIRPDEMIVLLEQIIGYLQEAFGMKQLYYKPVPLIYHRNPVQSDLYALFRLNTSRWRCDLSSTISLEHRGNLSQRRRRVLKKATSAGLTLEAGAEHYADFWKILSENLQLKYGKQPVHTVEEILELQKRFPEEIELITSWDGKQLIAGAVMFYSRTVAHAQYLAANDRGRELGGLDLVIESCIQSASKNNFRFFDFGISTDHDGLFLNNGLCAYKTEFGSGTTIYESYLFRNQTDRTATPNPDLP